MPCSDSHVYEDEAIKEKMDKLTRLLCRACYLVSSLAGGIPDEGTDKELSDWYADHCLRDRVFASKSEQKRVTSTRRKK